MGQVLLLQCLINQQVQSQERASTIGHVCAWVDREERIPTGTGGQRRRGEQLLMEGLLHTSAGGCVTLQVSPSPNEVTGSSVL